MQYASMVCKMDPKKEFELLERLKERLTHRSLPTQVEIADAAGVHQSTVSRASSGKLKRVTDTVRKLDEHVADFVRGRENQASADKRASPAQKPRRKISARKRFNAKDAGLARKRCDEYLDQGYSARALIDQIELLRQVQSPR